ncbi:MAG: glycerol-3-phosphate 1-O-acyltransferase PlsY [Pseudomonadota bacterium]
MPPIEATALALCFAAVMGYLVGAIPFGLIISRLMGLGDIRDIGSGNIGATNVLRAGSKIGAALTLLLDAAKGAVPLFVGRALIGEDGAQIAALFAILGHLFPVWLRFKGGKGVATALGISIALLPILGAISCVLWLVAAIVSRRSSVGALVFALGTPIAAIFVFPLGVGLTAVIACLIWVRHSANIERLLNGTEPKIGR